jgi:hypothetical protein
MSNPSPLQCKPQKERELEANTTTSSLSFLSYFSSPENSIQSDLLIEANVL